MSSIMAKKQSFTSLQKEGLSNLKTTSITSANIIKSNRSKSPSIKKFVSEILAGNISYLSRAITLIESTMLRTCAPLAIESSAETRTPGSVSITIAFYTQWVCARHATYLITTREEPRLRERFNSRRPKLLSKQLKNKKLFTTIKTKMVRSLASRCRLNRSTRSTKTSLLWKTLNLRLSKWLMKNQSSDK